MFFDRLKYIALAALFAVGLAGFGIGHWATASNGPKEGSNPPPAIPQPPDEAQANDAVDPLVTKKPHESRPSTTGRRREALIRLPVGSFTKEVDAAPYGSARLTWTYEDERVLGLIEGSLMGFEFELATEAEYSLSSNGTIYGLITSVRLNHVRIPDGEEYAELKPYLGLWAAVEPLVNETLMDVPFSYQFRLQGDRLVISNFRMLMAGPNPLGKVGGFMAGMMEGPFAGLAYFQALGTALEGTFTASDGKEKASPNKRPQLQKPRSRAGTMSFRNLIEHRRYTVTPSIPGYPTPAVMAGPVPSQLPPTVTPPMASSPSAPPVVSKPSVASPVAGASKSPSRRPKPTVVPASPPSK